MNAHDCDGAINEPLIIFMAALMTLAFLANVMFVCLILWNVRKPEVTLAIHFVPIYSFIAACCGIVALLLYTNLYYGRAYGGDTACKYYQAVFQFSKHQANIFFLTFITYLKYRLVVARDLPSHCSIMLGTSALLIVSVTFSIFLALTGNTGGIDHACCWCGANGAPVYLIFLGEVVACWCISIWVHRWTAGETRILHSQSAHDVSADQLSHRAIGHPYTHARTHTPNVPTEGIGGPSLSAVSSDTRASSPTSSSDVALSVKLRLTQCLKYLLVPYFCVTCVFLVRVLLHIIGTDSAAISDYVNPFLVAPVEIMLIVNPVITGYFFVPGFWTPPQLNEGQSISQRVNSIAQGHTRSSSGTLPRASTPSPGHPRSQSDLTRRSIGSFSKIPRASSASPALNGKQADGRPRTPEKAEHRDEKRVPVDPSAITLTPETSPSFGVCVNSSPCVARASRTPSRLDVPSLI